MTPGPIVSVVLLSDGDPRYEREFAESWVRQTCPADLYEIVVVGHADDSGLNDRFQGILRPQDRVLGVPRGGLELLHAGAVAARADWVFTTEDHCRGEPDCLARVVEFVPTATSVGAFMEYGHINKTWVGRLETASYERWFPIWTSSGWNNVRLRGMVLERNTFIEMAEQCRGYGPFFELAVAMRYHQRGHRMAAIPHLGLLHSNCHTLGELTGHTTEYIFGECRYRDDHHATEWEPYIDLPDEWIERGNFEGSSRPAASAALARTLSHAVQRFPGKTRTPRDRSPGDRILEASAARRLRAEAACCDGKNQAGTSEHSIPTAPGSDAKSCGVVDGRGHPVRAHRVRRDANRRAGPKAVIPGDDHPGGHGRRASCRVLPTGDARRSSVSLVPVRCVDQARHPGNRLPRRDPHGRRAQARPSSTRHLLQRTPSKRCRGRGGRRNDRLHGSGRVVLRRYAPDLDDRVSIDTEPPPVRRDTAAGVARPFDRVRTARDVICRAILWPVPGPVAQAVRAQL